MILLNISLEEINYFFKCLSFFKENSDFFLFCGTLSSMAVVLFNNRKTNKLSKEYKIRDVKLANDFKDRDEKLAKELKERDINNSVELKTKETQLQVIKKIIDLKFNANSQLLIFIRDLQEVVPVNNVEKFTAFSSIFKTKETYISFREEFNKILKNDL
jgi:hypothetical protein